MCDVTGGAYTEQPEKRLFRFQVLDEMIGGAKGTVGRLEVELSMAKARLKELERVRKLITPEDEAKIKALIDIGLIWGLGVL